MSQKIPEKKFHFEIDIDMGTWHESKTLDPRWGAFLAITQEEYGRAVEDPAFAAELYPRLHEARLMRERRARGGCDD